jgi:hypothetical protein
VLRFFDCIDHIEIAVVIMFVYKIGRNLHDQIKSGTHPALRNLLSLALLREVFLQAQ